MKLPRPYIPYAVRASVAERQADALGYRPDPALPASIRLASCLIFLFGNERVQLDHDPALCNRRQEIYSNGEFAGYDPPANDPAHLIYRKADDHKIKTLVRGDGAQRSDLSQRRYLKRVAAKQKPKQVFKPRRAKQIRRVRHDASIPSHHDNKTKQTPT